MLMLQVWWELASVTAPETNGVRDQDGPANHSWAPGRPGYRISSVKAQESERQLGYGGSRSAQYLGISGQDSLFEIVY